MLKDYVIVVPLRWYFDINSTGYTYTSLGEFKTNIASNLDWFDAVFVRIMGSL